MRGPSVLEDGTSHPTRLVSPPSAIRVHTKYARHNASRDPWHWQPQASNPRAARSRELPATCARIKRAASFDFSSPGTGTLAHHREMGSMLCIVDSVLSVQSPRLLLLGAPARVFKQVLKQSADVCLGDAGGVHSRFRIRQAQRMSATCHGATNSP